MWRDTNNTHRQTQTTHSSIDRLMKRDAGRMAEEFQEDSLAHLQVFVREAQGGFAFSRYFWCTIFTAFQYQTLFTQRAHKGPTANTPTQTAYKLIQTVCKLMALVPLQTHPHKLLLNWCHCKHTHANCSQTDTAANTPTQILTNWYHCKYTYTNCLQTDATANTPIQIAFKLMLLQTRPHRLLTNWCHWKTPTQIAHNLMPILYNHT